jgi:ankyrin repeat protein
MQTTAKKCDGSRLAPELQQAIQGGQSEPIATLLEADPCQLEASDPATGYGPLHLAAASRHIRVLRLLLDHGATPADAAGDGDTPALHVAVRHKNAEAAALLLARGADVNVRESDGTTALHIAAQNGDIGMLTLLLEHGADPAAHDARGRTPRQVMVENGESFAIRLLDEVSGHAARRRGVVIGPEEPEPSQRQEPEPPPSDGAEDVAVAFGRY